MPSFLKRREGWWEWRKRPNFAHPTFLCFLKRYKFQTSKTFGKKNPHNEEMGTVTQARNYAVTSHCHDIAALVFDLKLHTKQGKPFLLKKRHK